MQPSAVLNWLNFLNRKAMNDLFNAKRFWQFAKVRFAANRIFFLIPLFIPAIALLLIMTDLAFAGRIGVLETTFQMFIGFMAFFIFLILYSSRAFSEFHHRDRGFMLATLPASVFEKYLFSMLQVTVGFGILYAISFFVSAFMISGYNHAIGANFNVNEFMMPFTLSSLTEAKPMEIVYGNPLHFFTYLKLILTISSIFAAGSIFFRRFGFLFTSLVFIVYFWLATNIVALSYGFSGLNGFGNASVIFFLPFTEGLSRLEHNSLANTLTGIALFMVIIFLWIASYRRLKEKEY
jgi:hypothetical protein